MDSNPIYKFMKENNLTDMDEVSFVKAYSNPQKSAEIHKFMVENKLTDLDANAFHAAYFDTSKKKGGGQPASGAPQEQRGEPSAPSTGQDAFNAWQPGFKKEGQTGGIAPYQGNFKKQGAKPATKMATWQGNVPQEDQSQESEQSAQYSEWLKSITDEAKSMEEAYDEAPYKTTNKKQGEDEGAYLRRVASDQLSKRSFTPEEQAQLKASDEDVYTGNLEISNPNTRLDPGNPMSNPEAASLYQLANQNGLYNNDVKVDQKSYVEKTTRLWLDVMSQTNPSKASYLQEKYNKIKALPENKRSDDDERFLRDTEADAMYVHASGAAFKINKVAERIGELNGVAVTDEDKSELDNLFVEYDNLDNSLRKMDNALKINEGQYSYARKVDEAEDKWKQDRYNELAQGDGRVAQFFSSFVGAFTRGGLSITQVPKVWGDLIGDKDYDGWDEFYDSIEGTKRGVSAFFNDLPQGKKSSDLPFASRLALVGGNAVGSASTFIAGAYLTGGTSTIGQAASVFGTAFLTSEADYYQEALDAGMDQQSAAMFGSYLAAQSAALECIIPDAKFLKTPAFRRSVRNSVISRAKALKAGESFKDAMKFGYKDALKTFVESGAAYGKVGLKEAFFEEVPTQIAEDITKTVANVNGQKKYFNDTFDPEAYADAVLGSFVAGPAMNFLSRPQTKSAIQEETMRELAERKDRLFKKGTASDTNVDPANKKAVENVAQLLSAMKGHSSWDTLSREEQNHALAIAQQAEVIKSEQAEMEKMGVQDEGKQAQLYGIKNELNEMFSIQQGREKDVAKENKIKQIEEEFNNSIEGEEYGKFQKDEKDQEVIELQKKRKEAGINDVADFLSDMKPMVPFAVERMEKGQPVAESVRKASSDYLYKKYKELVDMKSNPNRMMTIQQIEAMQKQLEQDLQVLEGTAEVKTETNDQENVQGVSSEVGEGQEPVTTQPVEGTSSETPEAGGVLQAPKEEVDPKKVAVEKAQKQLEGVNSRINPNAKHPFFNVGQKHDDGNKYIVKNAEDNRTDKTKDGVEVITKILSPAEVDENGKMTKAADVEVGIFDSNEQAQEYVNSQYNKYKAMAEEKLAKAKSEMTTAEAKPTTEAAPETASTPFQKQKDLLGEDKQPWMYEATEAERNQAKNAGGKNAAKFFPKKISKIKDALQRGLFEKAIKEGRMTAQQADNVIYSAGLEIPASIQPKAKEAVAEEKPTRKERLAGLFKEEEKPAEEPVEKPAKAPAKPFSGIKNLFKKGFGGKRVSERESMSLIKELNTLIDRAEKENGVQRDSLNFSTWKTNDGYTVTEFFENKRGGTRITTPDGEEINIYDNKYKSETGKEISYFPEAGKPVEETKPAVTQEQPTRKGKIADLFETEEKPTEKPAAADPLKDVESTTKALEEVEGDLPLVRDIASKIKKEYEESQREVQRLENERDNLTESEKEAIIKKARYVKSNRYPDKYEFNTGASIIRKTGQQVVDAHYAGKIKKVQKDATSEKVLQLYRDQDKKYSTPKAVAQAYHADKAAGKETELTKAVEKLLGKETAPEAKPSEQQAPTRQGKIASLFEEEEPTTKGETPAPPTTSTGQVLKSANKFKVGDVIKEEYDWSHHYKVLGPSKNGFTRVVDLSETAIPGNVIEFSNEYEGFVISPDINYQKSYELFSNMFEYYDQYWEESSDPDIGEGYEYAANKMVKEQGVDRELADFLEQNIQYMGPGYVDSVDKFKSYGPASKLAIQIDEILSREGKPRRIGLNKETGKWESEIITEPADQEEEPVAEVETKTEEAPVEEAPVNENEAVNQLITKKNRYNKIPKSRKAMGGNLLNQIKQEAEALGFTVVNVKGGNISVVSKENGKIVARRDVDRKFNKERNDKLKEAKSMAQDSLLGLRASILLYFMQGGKVMTSQSELAGKSEIAAAKKAGLISDTGRSVDMIALEDLPEVGGIISDEQDAINEILDVLASYENKSQMEDDLIEMRDKLTNDMDEAAKYEYESQMRAAIRNDELQGLDEDELVEYYESLSEDEKVKTIEDYEKFYQEVEREQPDQGGQGGAGISPSAKQEKANRISEAIPAPRKVGAVEASEGSNENAGDESALEGVGLDETALEDWKKNNKAPSKKGRIEEMTQAVRDLMSGKVKFKEYYERAKQLMPSKLMDKVPVPASFKEIVGSIDKNKLKIGIMNLNKFVKKGMKVGLRIDIPAFNNFGKNVVTVHDRTGSGQPVIGYGSTGSISNVKFKTSVSTAAKIGAGEDKSAFAMAVGEWMDESPESIQARAEEALNSPEWIQVSMNPTRSSFFFDKADGNPVIAADEVLQVGNLVLAKNAKKIDLNTEEGMAEFKNMFSARSAQGVTYQFREARRNRLAKMFETSDGKIAAEKVANFLREANIDVEILDPKSFKEKGKQDNFEGDSDGVFLVDNNTGKIYLNSESLKGAEGKVIAFHEGIHPVVNIIRNTNPKLYQAIVNGLNAEASKNKQIAEIAAAAAESEYNQTQGPSATEDETVVETMTQIAAGNINIETFSPTLRERLIEFMNKIAKILGFGQIKTNSPRMELKRLADQLSKALNEGGKLSDIVEKNGVSKFQYAKRSQLSTINRTSAELRQLMEDSMDSVDEAIANGVDAQTAVNDNIASQDWYGELASKQKEQFDEILRDEFKVTPKAQLKPEAPVVKPTGVKAKIQNIVENYYKIKDGERAEKTAARDAINEILDSDPKLKYIYDNIREINKQLQTAGVITAKTDGCP